MVRILFAINHKDAEDAIIKSLNAINEEAGNGLGQNAQGKDTYALVAAVTYREALLTAIPTHNPDILVLLETIGGGIDIVELLTKIRFSWPDVRVILITKERKNDDPLLTTAASLGIYDIINRNTVNVRAIVEHIITPGTPQDVSCYFPDLAVHDQKQGGEEQAEQRKPAKGGFLGGLFGQKQNSGTQQSFAGLPEKSSTLDLDLLRETIRAEERKKLQSEIDAETAKAVRAALSKTASETESMRAELADAKATIQHRQDLIDKLTAALGEAQNKQAQAESALEQAVAEMDSVKAAAENRVSALVSKHQSEITQLEQQITELESNTANMTETAMAQAAEKEQELKKLLIDKDAKHAHELSALQQKLDQKMTEYTTLRNTTNSKINSLQDRLRNAENAKADLRAKLKEQEDDFNSEREEMDRKLAALAEKAEAGHAQANADTASELQDTIGSDMLLAQIDDLKKEVLELKANRTQMEAMTRKLQGELKDATAALKESQEEALLKDTRIQELSAKTDDDKAADAEREAQARFDQAEALFADANSEHELALKEHAEAEELKREYERKLSELEQIPPSVSGIPQDEVQTQLDAVRKDFDNQLDIMRRGYEATIQNLQLKLSNVQSQLDMATGVAVVGSVLPINQYAPYPPMDQQPPISPYPQADPRAQANAAPDPFAEFHPAYADIRSDSRTKVIAVAGATQGVGSTTLAVDLAAYLASNGKNVLLLEFNDFHPSVNEMFRLTRIPRGLGMAMKAADAGDAEALDRTIIKVNTLKSITKSQTRVYQSMPDGLNIIPYSNKDLEACYSENGMPMGSEMIVTLCQRLKLRETYDYIICDIRFENAQTLSELLNTGVYTQLIAVMSNDLHSIGNAKSMLSALSSYSNPKLVDNAILVVNRYVAGGAYSEKDASRIFGRDTSRIILLADDESNYAWAEKAGVPLALSSKDVAEEMESIVSLF